MARKNMVYNNNDPREEPLQERERERERTLQIQR